MPGPSTKPHFIQSVDSVLGRLTVIADSDSLLAIGLPNCSEDTLARRLKIQPDQLTGEISPLLAEAKAQLTNYGLGKIKEFDLPYRLDICTPFERDVLLQVYTIPYGQTRSYGEIAVQAGYPKAFRAVGTANARNPLPLLIPCHRVVASNGLGGYGGGLPMKRRLLALEQAHSLITEL